MLENYSIEVHAIKSDLKYLGIKEVADMFFEHEIKSKENDVEYIKNNFNNLIIELNKKIKILKEYIQK